MKRTLTAIAALSLLSACQAAPLAPSTASVPVLKGHVDFPGYSVQATSGQIVNKGTVSLIDGNGVARMAGTTDSLGNFTLYQSTIPFAPQPGQFYTLNVTKRYSNGVLMTLKTEVECQAGAWTSITGTTVNVNVTTTGVVVFDEKNTDVGPADVIGKVDMTDPANPVILGIGSHTSAEISGFVTDVSTALSTDADPSGPLTFTGSVTLTDQKSIDDISRYSVIDGSLIINLDPGISSFSLPNLKKVTGRLSTFSEGVANRGLTSLSGLSNLRYVGGNLELNQLPLVESFEPLSQLTTVGGNLDIRENDAVTSLLGLGNITKVGLSGEGGSFIVDDNKSLTSLVSFKFTSVSGYMEIKNNDALADIDGLELLTRVNSSVLIEDNDLLLTIDGLKGLSSAESITVDGNMNLVVPTCRSSLPALPLQYFSLFFYNNGEGSANCGQA